MTAAATSALYVEMLGDSYTQYTLSSIDRHYGITNIRFLVKSLSMQSAALIIMTAR